MGKSTTPKYRVEYFDNTSGKILPHTQAWDCKSYGRPSLENLEKWRKSMNQSFKPGGVNYHISESAKILIHITKASIVRQKDNVVVTYVKMPLFEAI